MKFTLVATVIIYGDITMIEEQHSSLNSCLNAGFDLMTKYPRTEFTRVRWDCHPIIYDK